MRKLLFALLFLSIFTAAGSYAQVQGDLEVISVDPEKQPIKKGETTNLVIGINQNGPDDLPTGSARINIAISETIINWVLPATVTDACGNLWTISTPNVTATTPQITIRNNAPLVNGYGCTISIPVIGVADGTASLTVGSTVFGGGASDPNGTNQGALGELTVDGTLPVTLTSFSAAKESKTVFLSWATTEEINSERFEIEKSLTGKNWDKIGTVLSHGESSSLKNYTFTDINPTSGNNLYRLKMVDKDDSYEYSRKVSVWFDGEGHDLSVYPNPVSNKLFVRDFGQVKNVNITDVNGHIMSAAMTAGVIDVQNLPSGMYVVRINRANGVTSTQKIVIAK